MGSKTKLIVVALCLSSAGSCLAKDYFTEHFSPINFDLEGLSLWFTPTNSADGYTITEGILEDDWVDDSDVSGLIFWDDRSIYYNIPNGQSVHIYDQEFGVIYLNANGNITFESEDASYSATFDHHFSAPRISMLLTDLNPYTYSVYNYGRISIKNTGSSIVATYTDVPSLSLGSSYKCTFQCQIFFTGEIRISWRDINLYPNYSSASTDAIVGLSAGNGIPEDFIETDFYSDSMDSDEDGLLDTWETTYFSNTSQCDPTEDTDGDGYNNRAEYICGTAPNDALSHFQLNTYCQNDCTILDWNSVSGRVYTVTSTTNLTEEFTSLSDALPYTQSSFTTAVDRARFFKVDINY